MSHGIQGLGDDPQQFRIVIEEISCQSQLNRAGRRKFGPRAEPAIHHIKPLGHLGDNRVHELSGDSPSLYGLPRSPRKSGGELLGTGQHFSLSGLVRLRQCGQERLEPGSPAPIVRREIRPAKEDLSVRREKSRQWPSAAARQPLDRFLVPAVNIGPLIPINLDRHIISIDERGNVFILIRLHIHHVAPVAPDRTDVEQDRLVFLLCPAKGLLPPGQPVHRLTGSLPQIGTRRISQLIAWRTTGWVRG